jgi:hypothetical protein
MVPPGPLNYGCVVLLKISGPGFTQGPQSWTAAHWFLLDFSEGHEFDAMKEHCASAEAMR